MAKKTNFYKKEEFIIWLKDIGKSDSTIENYKSYVNKIDNNGELCDISGRSEKDKLTKAKNISKRLLSDFEKIIENNKTSNELNQDTLRSKKTGIQAYKRFLSYLPNNPLSFEFDGISKLTKLVENVDTSLILHMVSNTLFPSEKLVKKRTNEIITSLRNNDKIHARFSSGNVYYQVINNKKTDTKFKNRKQAKELTEKGDFFYKDNQVKVIIDSNGNYKICEYLKDNTKINITSGDSKRNCYGYMISHIWSNAINPLFFSSFWNIALMPQYLSFILDKGKELASIKYAQELYKGIAYTLYESSILQMNDILQKLGRGIIIEKPDEDILSDATEIIKKNCINYIPDK